MLNFLLVATAAMFGVFSALLDAAAETRFHVGLVFLMFPYFFAILSGLYTDCTLRIKVAAFYIYCRLKKKAEDLVGQPLLQ